MEFDDFLIQPRWQILELLANSSNSPVKISEKIGTSVAYVSQQLKLLEAANIVKKKRTRAVEKGKPRLMYSIEKDFFYITSLVNKFPIKKKISPSTHQKIVLKIWMLDDKELVYNTEKLFWRIESSLDNIKDISIDTRRLKVSITSTKKGLDVIVQKFLKEINNEIDVEIISSPKAANENIISIYNFQDDGDKEEDLKP